MWFTVVQLCNLVHGLKSNPRELHPRNINTWWRHQMETISTLLAICAGNSLVPGEFPAQRPVTLMFSLICVWINGWVNNRDAGDLRSYRVHYDVTVMWCTSYCVLSITSEWLKWYIWNLPVCQCGSPDEYSEVDHINLKSWLKKKKKIE